MSTAVDRVRVARRVLAGGAAACAVAWGVASASALFAALSFASLAIPELALHRGAARALSLLSGAFVTLAFLWRARHVQSLQRVALWMEERTPALEYALVTAVEQRRASHAHELEERLAPYDITSIAQGVVWRSLTSAVAAAAVGVALLYASTSVTGAGRYLAANDTTRGTGVTARGSRITPLAVQITPPSYTGQHSSTLDDPSSVRALAGSQVIIRGPGDAAGLEVTLGSAAMSASSANPGWSVAVVMPRQPAALKLRDGGRERILVLDPRPDEPPRIALIAPQRDSTLRTAGGVQRLSATAADDIGLSLGRFEYLVTSGSGEVFKARTIETPVIRFGGSRSGSLSATLDLGAIGLQQGDVLSIRAIARDVNSVSGPGEAVSETRTFRIARADEYDSVSVDAAGPTQADSSAMSQRMLVMMTEKLVREQRTLTRAELVRRSTDIAELEDRIRVRVHAALFPDEVHAEPPPGAGAASEAHVHSEGEGAPGSATMIQAYNALWEAVRSLRIAEPGPALPPMRRALVALDRARLANRLYLRGTPPRIVVDLARVRMTGTEKGSGSRRAPLSPVDSVRASLGKRFGEALDLLPDHSRQAVRALALLRVDALASAPSFGAALGEAIDAFDRGRDATLPLLRARRALFGEPVAAAGLSSWSGAW